MLPAIDLHEDFIDEESIAIASVLSFQAAGINGAKLNAPQTNRFATDCDASFSEKVFDISMAEIEAVLKPDSIGNDVGWESMAFVYVHSPILSVTAI